MNKKIGITFYIFCSLILSSCNLQNDQFDLVITNIDIIDTVDRRIIANQTVGIKDGIIQEVNTYRNDKFDLPDSLVINGQDKYMISGFWNMHTHVCWKDDLDLKLFPILLSYGITGIRDMGGDVAILKKFKARIDKNPHTGPIIYGAGTIIDGKHPVHPEFSIALRDDNVSEILDSLMKNGVDFFKVYSLLPEEILNKILEYASDHNMEFVGHVSEYITPTEAIEKGQKSLEHLNRIDDLSNDSIALREFIETAKKYRSWICPTLIIYKRKVSLAQGIDVYHPLFDQMDNALKSEWAAAKEKSESTLLSPDELKNIRSKFDNQKDLVKLFYDNQLPMLIGNDFAGMPFIYPGFSYHEEMELMSQIGFDNYDILRMATYDPTVFFEITETHGTIEKGKSADLIILDKNPVEDIKNTLDIAEVIRAGKRIKLTVSNTNYR